MFTKVLDALHTSIPEKWNPGSGTLHLGHFLKYLHPYISSMSHERLHGEEQFRSKKYLLEMTPLRAKLRLKIPP